MMKLLDYIFLLRPMLIIPVWTVAILGARSAQLAERGLDPFHIDRQWFRFSAESDLNLLIMLGLATLVAGAAFVINQICDIETDRKNNKLFLLPQGHITVKEAWTIYIVATVVAIVGGFWFNWQLGVLFSIGALLGIQYSHPFFKVRTDAYKSFRNNVVAHGMLAFLFGWVLYLNFNIESFLRAIPYLLGVGAVYLNTTLPDIKGDKATDKATYAIEWGLKKTQTAVVLLVTSALILSVMTADYAFTIAAAAALPLVIWARLSGEISRSVLSSKMALLGLSLFAVIYFPLYLILLVVTIAATRFYYGARFSLKYPVLWEKEE